MAVSEEASLLDFGCSRSFLLESLPQNFPLLEESFPHANPAILDYTRSFKTDFIFLHFNDTRSFLLSNLRG